MKRKKPFKVVKSKLFKEQEKDLSTKDKKEVNRILKKIADNPMNLPSSMGLFNPPSVEELRKWMARVRPHTIDLVFEYLDHKGCLNKKGKKLAHDFWEKYIKEKS